MNKLIDLRTEIGQRIEKILYTENKQISEEHKSEINEVKEDLLRLNYSVAEEKCDELYNNLNEENVRIVVDTDDTLENVIGLRTIATIKANRGNIEPANEYLTEKIKEHPGLMTKAQISLLSDYINEQNR